MTEKELQEIEAATAPLCHRPLVVRGGDWTATLEGHWAEDDSSFQVDAPPQLHGALLSAVNNIPALIAEVRRLHAENEAMTTLRPMAEAPRDGEAFILLVVGNNVVSDMVTWCAEDECWITGGEFREDYEECDARGWLPIPEVRG